MFKKSILVAAVSLVIGMSSCTKNYTCECTTNGQTTNVVIKNTKKKAQDACDALNTAGQPDTSCKIK